MGKDGPGRRMAYAFATIAAVWLALILSAMSIAWLQLRPPTSAPLSIAVYLALLATIAFRAGFGRRTPAFVFLLAAILYPFAFLLILLAVAAMGQPDTFLTIAFIFAAGLGIGFQPDGGPDTPFEAYLLPWLLNLLVPTILVLGARGLMRRSGRD